MERVSVREEQVVIPTYPAGEKEKNPLFLEKRVYQGSSGAVYPYPVIESVGTEKEDHSWKALYLENEYLKIMILPELGGRVQMAYDKTNDYHFVYYNRVIKPALVGLTGPWISGGIEFNWPQHHRPGTYEPTDHMTEEHEDGSAAVWIGELEQMSRTRVTTAFRLRPGKAVLEIEARLYNGSAVPRTFLWWANPAVSVGDSYQSVFPPDVHAVMDHGKRDVSSFPIATGTYYKMDYSAGVDISRYKNIPVPTSYMACHSDYDFMGCYDHEKQAGMLHVANHHLVPGKKQWTWGNGDFGQAWDRNLTDEDGPYIELMTGAFTDNQPDFSWLQPGEEKVFRQNFMPYKELGEVANASVRAALSLNVSDTAAVIGVYATGREENLTLQLRRKDEVLFSRALTLTPEKAFKTSVARPEDSREGDFTLVLLEGEREILRARREEETLRPVPEPARAALPPEEIRSVEELYLTGLHLEQYRHATRDPEAYYREGLKRDPGESRCLTALGKRKLARGDFKGAEKHFLRAVERQTLRNPNPYDGEALFQLGQALKMQGRREDAYDRFYKSVWNGAWQGAGYTELARISSGRGEWDQALLEADRAIAAGQHNRKALHVKTVILRQTGQKAEARRVLEDLKRIDPLDHAAWFEEYLLCAGGPPAERDAAREAFERIIRDNAFSRLELSLDYMWCGCFGDASALLELTGPDREDASPLALYYQGYFRELAGCPGEAEQWYLRAAAADPAFCFPSRPESVMILEHVMKGHPEDVKAPYYAGNFYYHNRRFDRALKLWERAAAADPTFPTVRRNLALGAFNKQADPLRARRLLEEAFRLDPMDARVMFELDQLYRKLGLPAAERLAFLEEYPENVSRRDDLTVERLTLLNLTGRPDRALEIMSSRRFQPWEGGEGRVSSQYVRALIMQGVEELERNRPEKAGSLLERARSYPHNLGEGKLVTMTDNELDYFRGVALEASGRPEEAAACFRSATEGTGEPASAMYYNDQSADLIYYQGLACLKLDRPEDARGRFNTLLSWGKAHFHDTPEIDYFAVSLPDLLIFDEDLAERNRTCCRYLMALGEFGLGNRSRALDLLDEVVTADPAYPGAGFLKGMWTGGNGIPMGMEPSVPAGD